MKTTLNLNNKNQDPWDYLSKHLSGLKVTDAIKEPCVWFNLQPLISEGKIIAGTAIREVYESIYRELDLVAFLKAPLLPEGVTHRYQMNVTELSVDLEELYQRHLNPLIEDHKFTESAALKYLIRGANISAFQISFSRTDLRPENPDRFMYSALVIPLTDTKNIFVVRTKRQHLDLQSDPQRLPTAVLSQGLQITTDKVEIRLSGNEERLILTEKPQNMTEDEVIYYYRNGYFEQKTVNSINDESRIIQTVDLGILISEENDHRYSLIEDSHRNTVTLNEDMDLLGINTTFPLLDKFKPHPKPIMKVYHDATEGGEPYTLRVLFQYNQETQNLENIRVDDNRGEDLDIVYHKGDRWTFNTTDDNSRFDMKHNLERLTYRFD